MVNHSIVSRHFWIFDLDGTLTLPQHDFAAIKMELGIPEDADILGHLSLLSPQDSAKKRRQLDCIEVELAHQAKPATGVNELITALASSGIQMGLLTRNSKANAHITLETIGLSPYFAERYVLGRDESEPKPSPQGISSLLNCWQIDARHALMVGDYVHDLKCARAAGVAAVHVDTAERFLWPEYTDLGVRDLARLHQIFEQERRKT